MTSPQKKTAAKETTQLGAGQFVGFISTFKYDQVLFFLVSSLEAWL